jgi:hypothetical protein
VIGVIEVPKIYKEGIWAANLGTHMHSTETPLGFTFCPYRDGSIERWNFIGGCVAAYMQKDVPIMGEQ